MNIHEFSWICELVIDVTYHPYHRSFSHSSQQGCRYRLVHESEPACTRTTLRSGRVIPHLPGRCLKSSHNSNAWSTGDVSGACDSTQRRPRSSGSRTRHTGRLRTRRHLGCSIRTSSGRNTSTSWAFVWTAASSSCLTPHGRQLGSGPRSWTSAGGAGSSVGLRRG